MQLGQTWGPISMPSSGPITLFSSSPVSNISNGEDIINDPEGSPAAGTVDSVYWSNYHNVVVVLSVDKD